MNPARTLRTGLALLAVHGAAIATQVAPTPVPAQHGEEAGILPGMEDRSSLDAYLLLKDRGLEIPLELALQVNASMTVNPADPADRQAGGSPGTAWPIPDTAHGDTFQDSGSTIPLSNFIQELVAFTGSCFQDANLAGNDAWYTFTLAQPTRVQATTCGGVIAFDTELAVLTTGLDPVAINDDFCGYFTPHSTIDCCLDPGTYYLVVDGYAGSSGPYDLDVSFLACPAPVPGVQGGPDAFGYTWNTSDDPTGAGPDFDWLDISTETAVTLGDNDATPPIPIGFGFTYYGTTYTNVYIGSNGLVGFTGTSLSQFTNTVLPTAGIPNRMIAAFWDDLAPNAGGSIRYYSDVPNGRFIVQFTSVPAFATGGLYTFQVVLHRGGDIVISYWDVADDDVSQATIGIENQTGTIGLTANFNGAGWQVSDFSSIRFTAPRPTSGGPDAFGYTWISSDDPASPPASRYEDGGAIWFPGDDQTTPVALPFEFPFYGTLHSLVTFTSNGWIGFGSPPALYENQPVPDPVAPNDGIYVLMDDYHLPFGGTLRISSDLERVVFHWDGLHPAAHPDGLVCDFQLVLFSDGRIHMNFIDVSEYTLSTVTVGIENAAGTDGLQILNFGTGMALHDNLTVRITPPAADRPTRGGPEAGYAWINSLDPAGPVSQFNNISSLGTNLGLTGDDENTVVELPFAFPWFGGTRDAVTVCSNGWISFDLITGEYFDNRPIPDTGGLHSMICPFWDDLYLPGGGQVYYLDNSLYGHVIFQWHQIPHLSGGDGPYTFQLVLYANGEMLINYGDMGLAGNLGVNSATVGLENSSGTRGLQIVYNGTGSEIREGLSIAIHPVGAGRPAPITDLRIVQDAVPLVPPFQFHYEWSPVSQDVEGNPLSGVTYDFYYRTGSFPYEAFPEDWTYFNSYATPYTSTLNHSMAQIQVRFVAVNAEGLVLGGAGGSGEGPVPAESLRSRARKDDGTVLWPVGNQRLK